MQVTTDHITRISRLFYLVNNDMSRMNTSHFNWDQIDSLHCNFCSILFLKSLLLLK